MKNTKLFFGFIAFFIVMGLYFLFKPRCLMLQLDDDEKIWNDRLAILQEFPKYAHYFEKVERKTATITPRTDDTILVSVASYRDSQCGPTIQNLIETAAHPEKLRIVVCQQNAAGDEDCSKYCGKCAGVEFMRLSDQDARGPTWARFLLQQEWKGEAFFLQLDSHIRMTKHWDTDLVDMVRRCQASTGNPKIAISQYPSDYKPSTTRDPGVEKWETDRIRGGIYIQKWDEDGFFRIQSDYASVPEEPFPSKAVGADFLFGPSQMILDAPVDPYTPFLFFGEEQDLSVRLYTHGWRFFSPDKSLVFTSFDRSYRPTFWEHPDQAAVDKLSRLRLYHRLELMPEKYQAQLPRALLIDAGQYAVGAEATVAAYYAFIQKPPPKR